MIIESPIEKLKNLINNIKNFSFRKTSFALVATGLIFTSATLAAVKISKQPDIKWTPEKLEITLFTGTSKVSSASFISNENLENAKLELVPELAKFAFAQPAEMNEIAAGKNNSVNLFFSVPQETATGTYDGTLHLKLDKKTIPQTLKIILNIKEPTADYIPDDISYPTADKIYNDEVLGGAYINDEILVVFQNETSQERIKQIIYSINGSFLGSIPDLNMYQIRVKVNRPSEISILLQQLNSYPEIDTVSHHWLLSEN